MIRFDKPCLLVLGAVEYFREYMQVGDYLTEGDRVEMTWYREGVKCLGLGGVCRLQDFGKLCHGVHPISGVSLMVRNKGVHRRECSNSQFSPPKDVSIRNSCVIYHEVHLRGRRETVIFGVIEESPVIRKVRRPCKTA